MNTFSSRRWIGFLLTLHFCLFSFPTASKAAVQVVATGSGETRAFSETSLRAYGTVSGTYRDWPLASGPASILQINCQDIDKAKLVQAKYVSDLQVLPGVSPATDAPDGLKAFRLIQRNYLAAVRYGTEVFVLNAANAADLHTLYTEHLSGDKTSLALTPEITEPMYLDRYDKYGFRFYYYAWQVPPENAASKQPYDYSKDFDDAAQFGTGLVHFTGELRDDTAEGQSEETFFTWAFQGAKAKGLPQGINNMRSDPSWLLNRYRSETGMRMPGFTGSFYGPGIPGTPMLSWNSLQGNDAQMANLQMTVRRFASEPTVTSWMEPNGELDHGAHDIFLDFGPAADTGFRRFLQEKYQDIAVVSQRWARPEVKTWDQVKVPELIHFFGGDKAIDLTGPWKIGRETGTDGHVYTTAELLKSAHLGQIPETTPAPAEWYSADFNDSAWPEVVVPSDRSFFLPKWPAVYRRTIQISGAQRAQSDHWWLYVWDLNRTKGKNTMTAYVNGATVGDSPYQTNDLHRGVFEITSQLHDGANQISFRVPFGYLGYRVYISPDGPADYPNLTEGKNAEWVDFCDWRLWAHYHTELSGTEMIREVDPDRPLEYAHPDEYMESVRRVMTDFGGEFHCTGYMSGFWADQEPMMARGIGAPATVEPGGPAADLPGFQKQMGLNLTEGIQAIDYFINIGDVTWHPDIRKYFEDNLKVISSIGKYHPPKAETAILFSERCLALTNYPFGYGHSDPNILLPSGYWYWDPAAPLMQKYAFDGLGETDFANGNASNYRVVIDSNTSVLDDAAVDNIEKFVRQGGIFITFVQTGRHSTTKADAWPICRLTGYDVTHIDPLTATYGCQGQSLQLAPNQDVFAAADWGDAAPAYGMSLKKRETECRDLMLWPDGTTAIGMRPLGKGFIVQVAARFNVARDLNRWEGGPLSKDSAAQAKLFEQLLQYFKVTPIQAHLEDPGLTIFWRHYVSNNGLYDVWTLWNMAKTPTTASLVLDQPASNCIDLVDGKEIPIDHPDGRTVVKDLAFAPLQTRILVTPRIKLETAAADWLTLQRNWWHGTAPISHKLKPLEMKLASDLNDNWAFHPVGESEAVEPLLAAAVDDSAWEHRRLDIWTFPDHRQVKHGVYRKAFTVPENWKGGRVELWMRPHFYLSYTDKGRIFLDGQKLTDWSGDGVAANDAGGAFTPGSHHELAIEITSDSFLAGCRAACWLAYIPNADASMDLQGDWTSSADGTQFDTPMPLPGAWDTQIAKRTLHLDSTYADRNVVVDFDGPPGVSGVMINGTWVPHIGATGMTEWRINITPWVKFNGDNEIELVAPGGPLKGTVKTVQLLFYKPAAYP
jgi:hypothetical protein